MCWRELGAIATIFVALVVRLCGGISPTEPGFCSQPIWATFTTGVNYTTSLLVEDNGSGQCTARFAALNDKPQLTFCWLTYKTSDELLVVLKLPGCGNSYISSRSKDRVIVQDDSNLTDINDPRVWKIVSCDKRTSNAFFTTFFQYDERRSTYTYLTVKEGQLTFAESIKAKNDVNPACYESAFTVYLYPSGPSQPDMCESEILKEIRLAAVYTTRIGKRQVHESLGRLIRLTITIGDDKHVLVRKRYENGTFSNELQIEKLETGNLSPDSLFYYLQQLVSEPNGEINELPNEATFTLLHALSRQYITADVTRNSLLNVGGALTGLTFQDAEHFPDSAVIDYRHFKVYKKHVGSGGVKAVFVCSVQFRSYCFLPARSGSLELYPVDGGNNAGKPTFQDPSDAMFAAFSTVAGFLAASQRVPSFGVYERSSVAALGAPEVVFISEYSSSSGGAQGSGQRRVLSYDPASNRIILTSYDQALQSPYRIVRQQWTEPGSSSIYISLSVITGSQPQFSLSGRWITRSSSSPVSFDSTFKSVDLDDRLFSTKCCLCSQSRNDVQSVFYNKGGKIAYLSIAQNGTLILRELAILPAPTCVDNALTISTS